MNVLNMNSMLNRRTYTKTIQNGDGLSDSFHKDIL